MTPEDRLAEARKQIRLAATDDELSQNQEDAIRAIHEVTRALEQSITDQRQQQIMTDGGEDAFVPNQESEPDTVLDEPEPVDHASDYVGDITAALELPSHIQSTAEGMADRAQFEHALRRSPMMVAAGSVYLAALLHDHDEISQRSVAEAADVSPAAVRETYLDLGNAPDVLPHWYYDTSDPDPEETDAGLIERVGTWVENIRTDSEETEEDEDEQDD